MSPSQLVRQSGWAAALAGAVFVIAEVLTPITLAAIDRGLPRKEVQDLFGISRSTVKRWLNRRRQTGASRR